MICPGVWRARYATEIMATIRLSVALAGLACQGLVLAQVPNQSRGVLSGAATTVLVDGGMGGANDAETLFHANGFSQAAPQSFPALPSSPNLAAIFQFHGAPPGIDVDDISSGRDDLLVDANGVLDVPPNSWSVWSFSLRNGAQGQAGSRIEAEATHGDVGAALFSYVLPGSFLPNQLLDVVERSHSKRDLGLGGVSPDVDGLDFPIALGLDQQLNVNGPAVAIEPGFAPLINTPETIYFTVSHATKGLVPASWWQIPGGPTTAPSGATIFVTLRSSINSTWSPPHVFYPYYDLGLGVNEDIDALAYSTPTERLLFSVVGTLRDQFLFLDLSTDGAMPVPNPVTKPGGTPISQSVGKLQTDDVDAICTLDPVRLTGGGLPPGGDDFGSSCGHPRDGLLGVPRLSGSAYRRFESSVVRYDTHMVGWPPIAGQAPGFSAVFLTSQNNIDPVLIALQVRNPANTQEGDPQSASIVVPAALALSGQDFTFRWIALDFATAELAEAWPVRVYL